MWSEIKKKACVVLDAFTWSEEEQRARSVAALLMALVFLVAISVTHVQTRDQRKLEQVMGFPPDKENILVYQDTHRGFHGDGEVYAEVRVSQWDDILMTKGIVEGWHSGSVSETLSLVLYGGERDGVTYGPCGKDLPQIQDGFWYFQDRASEARDPYSDRDLLDRSAQNYTFALYDPGSNILYFYQLNT